MPNEPTEGEEAQTGGSGKAPRQTLRELLNDPDVGRTTSASLRAIRAICRSLASQETVNPYVIGPIELIADTVSLAARVARLTAQLEPDDEALENEIGRRIGAARILLKGRGTEADHGALVVSRASLMGAVAAEIEDAARQGFNSADEGTRLRMAERLRNVILAIVGQRPPVELTMEALRVALNHGAPKGPRGKSSQGVRGRKRDVYSELFDSIGLTPPENTHHLRQDLHRGRWFAPRGNGADGKSASLPVHGKQAKLGRPNR